MPLRKGSGQKASPKNAKPGKKAAKPSNLPPWMKSK